MLPLSLYIHIPWCVRKCPYCDFNSHPQRGEIPEAQYIQTLMADLENLLPKVWGRPVSSIYFGGGTPSLFSAKGIDEILAGVRSRLMLEPQCEITLEANPGTVEHDRFEAYREAGVNRISMGIQSFDNALLERLGRIHNGDEACHAIEAVKAAGFQRFNLDLMHGLPGQDLAMALHDVRTALRFEPPHLSHYQLTIEPNTAFAAQPPVLPEDDALDDIQEQSHQRLRDAGLEHYEVSAWSLPGEPSRHNMNYWQYGDYLGIGAGAHGKITELSSGKVWRYGRQRHPNRYLAAQDSGEWNGEERYLEADDRLFEFFFNGLRLRQGVNLKHLSERARLSQSKVQAALDEAQERGLLVIDDERAQATDLGWRFMNDLQGIFLP
jgi:oxygen-independent coproporphyrinogen-3 oxidase